MYHCHINFYCIGQQPSIFETIQAISPLRRFTHSFTATPAPDADLTAQADVILADLRDLDAGEALRTLVSLKKEAAQLILLADREQLPLPCEYLPDIKDIWVTPMEEEELRFRFLRWQQACQVEKDLWFANNCLETTINGSPFLIWYKDREGIYRKVNGSFCRTAQKAKEEVEGCSYAAIWDVDEEDPIGAQFEMMAMEYGETCVHEEIVHAKDGDRILTDFKTPLFDLDGTAIGTVGVAMDVTQEREYEDELLKQKNTLETLFTTMECGIICHNMDGSIRSINRAALNILGYESQEELEADGFNTVASSVVEEDKPKLEQCIRSLHRVNDSSNVEYRVLHKDGQILHVMGNVKLACEDGEMFYQRFLLDCTAQKLREQAEQLRMDSKIKYQQQLFDIFSTYLANNTDDVYMMLAEDGKTVEYVSPNVERVLGIPPGKAGEDLSHFSCVQDTGEEQGRWENLSRMEPGESLQTIETRRINPQTGEHKWFQESIYCVSLQEHKKIIIYISDRTKEKKAQEDLAAALNVAQIANKAKSNFLSSVSHDIRTPMNAIMGFVTLLRGEAGNQERVLEYTQQIDAASHHLLGLINDVLDMNKIESGAATLNISALKLADIIDDLNAIIRPQAVAKKQSFNIHVSGFTSEHLLGDRLRINQILINILSNAVKYTQKGGSIIMTVAELPQTMDNYSRVQFVVADNGQGMSEEYQKIIFNPFTREQSTMTNQIQGTGLGMSITKSLVDMMGGSIRVESKLGQGSTFIVELELRIQRNQDYSAFWKEVGVSRVLVVDANSELRESVAYAIAGTGLEQVNSTADGTAAAEMIRKAQEGGHPYDLILLDWEMASGKSGLEAARTIRKSDPAAPILVLSDFEQKYIEKDAHEVNIHYFMTKPFFMSNFKDVVRRMMSVKSEEPPAEESPVKGRHILVVDDIYINRLTLMKILTTLGATCEMAENGQIAVDKFLAAEPGTYDMILMDIQMPVMDGYQATRTIRASGHPSAHSVAIIAMTANAFTSDVRDALDAGMDAHIAKPIMLPQMQATIRDVMCAKEHDSH